MHDRNRLLGTTVTTYIGSDGPQPLGSLTRAVQLELPPPNDIVEESVTRQWIVSRCQLAHKLADTHRPNLGTQCNALSAEIDHLECSRGHIELAP